MVMQRVLDNSMAGEKNENTICGHDIKSQIKQTISIIYKYISLLLSLEKSFERLACGSVLLSSPAFPLLDIGGSRMLSIPPPL